MKIATFFKLMAPRRMRHLRIGFCPLCQSRTLFVHTGPADTVRNHANCARCLACSRNRHLAHWILESYRNAGITRLSDFSRKPGLIVYQTCSSGAILAALGGGKNILRSEFFDGAAPGETRNGVQNQDLQNLSFADASIDLILSEDVFEHVPDYRKGFAEVLRVLKPGGRHIFTIPYKFDARTRELFRWENGKRVLFEPIEYHGDPVRGEIPCYTHLGTDLIDFLEELGFEARIEIASYGEQNRIGAFNCFTFITRKKA